ncbi:MAG: nucleotidyltransferase domain-containing protein [Anaerolineales bacterium]|nr:nucleotidyltransferase domain-containing protein [Anaerolineales bacterium]
MIDFDRQQLIKICQTHNIRKLYLFGSISRAEQRPDSDIDLLAEFGPTDDPLNQFFGAQQAFEKMFQRKVDLLETSGIEKKPRFKARVDQDKVMLYAS